jgi:hypothetical protein
MKKNLLLLGILISLLIVTYYFQEKKTDRKYLESQREGKVFLDEIQSLEMSDIKAVKKDGRWFAGETLLSHNQMKQLEQRLKELKVIKDLEGGAASLPSSALRAKINDHELLVGDLALDRQSFYISINGSPHLAIIDGESSAMAQSPEELEGLKLQEFKSMLLQSQAQLKETQLFRYYPNLPVERAMLEVQGHLPFELNFKSNETAPPPVSGVAVQARLQEKFISLLTQVNFKEEVPFSAKLKFRKLGEIKFLGEQKVVKWELWLKDEKSADAYLIDEEAKKAWLMIGGTLRIFFIQIQDYWDKKVIPASSFKSFSRLDLKLRQGSREVPVTVLNREPLDFTSKTHKIKLGNMQDLFQFIFNLGERDQAHRVSNLASSERKQLLNQEHLRLEIMGQELLLWRKPQELIVVNLTQGFKTHFHVVMENFNAQIEDVIEF